MPIVERIFYIFACVLAMAFNGNAQQSNVVVNGLRVCEFYSREQMYEALGGVPDKIEKSEEFVGEEWFYYGKDVFYWYSNAPYANEKGIYNYFGGCQIYTDRYVIFDSIRVGDSIEKLKTVPGITENHPRKYKDGKEVDGGYIKWYQSEELRKDYIWVTFYYDESAQKIDWIHVFFNNV